MKFSQFYLGLLQGLLEGKDLPFFARQLAREICKPVLITDPLQRILAAHDHAGVLFSGKDDLTFLDANEAEIVDLMAAEDLRLSRTCWQANAIRMEGLQLPLASRGRIWGYCYVVSDSDLSKQEMQYLLEAALVILLTLSNLSNWREEQEQYQSEFIRDILYNNYDSQAAIIAKARTWGWELSGAWALAVGEVDTGNVKIAKELVPLESINKRHPIATVMNGQLLVLIPLPGNKKNKNRDFVQDFMKKITSIFSRRGFTKIEFGVGSFADSVDYLYKVYQEAKIALQLGSIFDLGFPCYFEDMGVLKFVFSQPAFELQEFSQRVLGDLFAYDREKETELIDTLKAFFRARMQIPECARLLIIHENTLRNRLKKIEELTGFDLRRIDHLVNIYVACLISKAGQQEF